MGEPTYTCWCDGDCDNPASGPFRLCSECHQFGHRRAPTYGLTADDLWPASHPRREDMSGRKQRPDYPIPMGTRLPPDPDPTTPHALWVEAQAAFPNDAEAAARHYAELMVDFGHLVPRKPGEDRNLPCGWPHEPPAPDPSVQP